MAPYGYSYGRKCFGELHKPSTYFKVFVSVLKNRLRGKKLAKDTLATARAADPPLPPVACYGTVCYYRTGIGMGFGFPPGMSPLVSAL